MNKTIFLAIILVLYVNAEVIPFGQQEQCCGFGGTFAIKEPEISASMVLDKATHIRNAGVDRLISQDCGCLMNISGTLEKQGDAMPSQHIAEFLWERTSLASTSLSQRRHRSLSEVEGNTTEMQP